jgi:hypothetical protein
MSTVEIRSYEGDGGDLAELVDRVWRAGYGGRYRIPLWDPGYFRWRLLDERGGGREYLICAYRGERLVACLLAEPMDFEVRGRPVRGTASSWLSVDPEVRAPGLALRLVEELRRRQRRDGLAFSMGYSSSDPAHPARQFWDQLAKRRPAELVVLRRLTFWGRVFDARAVSASALDRFERWAPWAVRHVPWAYLGWREREGVRPFAPQDLSRCGRWIESSSAGLDLRLRWTPPRLELQLGSPYARTLLLERGGRGAVVNYYPTRQLGRTEIRVAMIDLVAGDLGWAGKVALLKAAGHRMMEEGLHAAFMMESAATPTAALLAAGFVPFGPGIDLFCYLCDPDLGLRPTRRFDVLFG